MVRLSPSEPEVAAPVQYLRRNGCPPEFPHPGRAAGIRTRVRAAGELLQKIQPPRPVSRNGANSSGHSRSSTKTTQPLTSVTQVPWTVLSPMPLTVHALKMSNHRPPVWEFVRTEMDVLTPEAIYAIFGSIIYEVMAIIQILVVRKNQALVCRTAKVTLYPQQLIRPRAWVFPWGSRKNVCVVEARKLLERLNGIRHRIHKREDARDLIKPSLVLSHNFLRKLRDARWKIDKNVIHVDV